MKKGIYIDESKSVEIVSFSKASEYVAGSKSKLTDILNIYASDNADTDIEINEDLYGLPVLIVPKSKMNDYDMEALLAIFDGVEVSGSIEISDDDFFTEEDDDEDEYEGLDDREPDWY